MAQWSKALACFFFIFSSALFASPKVPVLTVADSINPGSGDYLIQGIESAEKANAPFVLIVLDTPGGLLSTTRQIVQKILTSKLPIVVFVGPRGAHAGSAGALITLAADVAAMAPATNIGAAHPVSGDGESKDAVMSAKLTNDTAAFAESIAKSRGRNTDWAIKAVRDSASIIAEEALKQSVIDLIAENSDALVEKLPGFRFKAAKGGLVEIPHTKVELEPTPMGLKHRVVSFLANPNLAYLIMSLGTLCIWIELSHPGLILPGVVGVLCILLSLVSFQMLPISYGALALLFVGIAFIVAELFLPAYGVLGVGGVICFILGSLFLMDTASPELQISLKLIFPTAAVLASAAVFLGMAVLRARNAKLRSGLNTLVGELAEVREMVTSEKGKVFVQGEWWNAIALSDEFPKGTIVIVKEVRGMQLVVGPQKEKKDV
jgi:membrane-bound serine protease (ClpP class)